MDKLSQALAGHFGNPEIRYRMFLSNIHGDRLTELRGLIREASVSMSNYREHTWKMDFEMTATDRVSPMHDYFLPICEIRAGRDIAEEFPLGIYRSFLPETTYDESQSVWNIGADSLEMLLSQDGPDDVYSLPFGTDILGTVRDILTARGIPNNSIVFPNTVKTLRNSLDIDPATAEDLDWLQVCNRLLSAGGFYGLQTDAQGRFVTEDMPSSGSSSAKAPDIVYGPVGMPYAQQLITGKVGEALQDNRFANKVYLRSQDVNDTPPITAVAVNDDPGNPASTVSLGYTRRKKLNPQTVTDQDAADRLVQAELKKATALYQNLKINTFPDPRRGLRETYKIYLQDVRGRTVVDSVIDVVNWTLPLSNPPQTMSHDLGIAEDLKDVEHNAA